MRIARNAVFALLLTAGFTLVGIEAFAAVTGTANTAGESVVQQMIGAMTGNIGLLLGLGLAILGIWTWVVKQETAAGIFLIIGGVLLTVSPAVFNTIGSMVGPIVQGASGANVNEALTGAELGQQR